MHRVPTCVSPENNVNLILRPISIIHSDQPGLWALQKSAGCVGLRRRAKTARTPAPKTCNETRAFPQNNLPQLLARTHSVKTKMGMRNNSPALLGYRAL